ncbi:MAG: hypothetical protein WC792_04585 [Candidatus Micrarchaeia archaeon]
MAVSREEIMAAAKAGVKKEFSRKDLALMQAVRSLDDIDGAKSILYTRLDEWLKLNFPELSLQNEETVCSFVEEFACKEEIDAAVLEKMVGPEKAAGIIRAAQKSFGAQFDMEDRQAIRGLASGIKRLFDTRKEIEDYISTESTKALKNISYLTDPMLAARLVTTAGGLERLAKMPGSTVQVIGAETALFKHLRAGTLPPKHGIIFQSAYIRGAPYELRGRIARSLAAKLAIAAKADFYTQHFIAEKLKADFEKRLDELHKAPHKEKHEFIPPNPYESVRGRSSSGRSFSGPRREGGRPAFRGGGERREGERPAYRPSGDRREGGYRPSTAKPPFRPSGPRPAFREGARDAPREGSSSYRGAERREGERPAFRPRPPFRPTGGDKPREGGYRPPSGDRPQSGSNYRGAERREGGSGYRGGSSGGRPFKKFNKNRR